MSSEVYICAPTPYAEERGCSCMVQGQWLWYFSGIVEAAVVWKPVKWERFVENTAPW